MAMSPFHGGASPWRALQEMREQMDRLLGFSAAPSAGGGEWSPSIDLEDRKDEIVLTAELPGLRPEDIDVQVKDDVVMIRGEKKEEHETKKGERFLYERRYGSFARSIPLPQSVDAARASARFEGGVLRITLPKTQEAGGHRIQIDGGH